MKLKLNKWIVILMITVIALSVAASASMLIPANDRAKGRAQAPENSPVIGDNWDLVRVDFVHYAKPSSPAKVPGTDSCYKLMGVKWTTFPVNYVINPTNLQGLTEEFVTSSISTAAETWDGVISKELFNNVYSVDYAAQYGVQNYENAIVFGDYPESNVIGVTSVWYTRVGKKIVEFDMLFNTKFAWGDSTLNPAVMDLQNIAVHELGHSVGLSDLYSSTCSTVTMYGYSSNGETQKRTLEQPDVTGLQKMYGI